MRRLNENLYKAFLSLKTVEECGEFLEDICTPREIENLASRLEAARLLLKGYTYEDIMEKVNISSSTLSKVNKSIKFGEGGYEKVIDRIMEK